VQGVAFFRLPVLVEAGFATVGWGDDWLSETGGAGLFSAEGRIEDEILLRGLFLPEEDFAMIQDRQFLATGKGLERTLQWR
jgi:hypothetical protein